jgi:arginine exporter protein ArgO
MLLVLGVFLGSAMWWFVLSGTVGLLLRYERFSAPIQSKAGLRWVNGVSGIVIASFGVLAISGLG